MKIFLFIYIIYFTNSFAESIPKLESSYSEVFDLHLENGLIYSYTNNTVTLKTQISSQLKFLIGYFNNFNSGPDLERLDISDIKAQRTGNGFKVAYKATLTVAWARGIELPKDLILYLPERGTADFISRFTSVYGGDKYGNCRDDYPDAPTSFNFFYHYRPLNGTCKIKERIAGSNDLLVTINTTITPSLRKSFDKSPEYSKIWNDNELSVFIIDGKYERKGLDDTDDGVAAFRKMYKNIIAKYGAPNLSNVENKLNLSSTNPFVEIEYIFADQTKMTIRIFLVGQLSTPTPNEVAVIQKYTAISDVVIYSGHAGLGANSDKLINLAKFQKNKYQIYFIDGCDTFSYVGKKLFSKVSAINNGKKGTLFLDVITNAMPSYFTSSATNNINVIDSMIGSTDTYYELLLKIDEYQRSVVDGEEDNLDSK